MLSVISIYLEVRISVKLKKKKKYKGYKLMSSHYIRRNCSSKEQFSSVTSKGQEARAANLTMDGDKMCDLSLGAAAGDVQKPRVSENMCNQSEGH